MVLLSGVEIFSAGIQTDSAGFTDTFTVEDIDLVVDRFNSGSPEFVPVKMGHTSDPFNQEFVADLLNVPKAGLSGENGGQDGVISLGRVTALRRQQDKLLADFDIPVELKDLVDRGFLRDVSVEMVGKSGDWNLTAVAWLGAELPAVKNLNGLAAAASLRQRIEGPVLAFKQRATLPDKETEMDLLKLFRSASEEEKAEIADLLNFQEEDEDEEDLEMEDDESTAQVAPITGEAAAAVKAILGCEMNCSDEELIDALRNMVGLPSSTPAEEVVPVMKAKLESKPVAFKDTPEFKQMSGKIDDLERDKRVSHWRRETAGLLVQGKDEDLAEKLTALEASAGTEVAEEMLTAWKNESEANKQYTTAVGRASLDSDDNEYEFEARAKKIAEEQEISFDAAKARLSLEDGAAFARYRAEKANNNG